MESNQTRVEEVASNNIVERELQPPKPPKRKKKKVSFAVWLEQYAPEELKTSAENIKQQDASVVIENESIAKAQETVDQKGDRPTPESESNEKNQVPFKTWSEEHVPVDQAISAGNIEKQNNSLVSEEESTAGVQETIDIAEKEQPSKSKEQPSRTRRNRKKMIPFHIWLEKHAPADLKISAESTGMEDVSLDTKQESIPVLQEIPEKEQPSKSGAENVIKQDISLPKEEGDQEDSLKKEICEEEPVISTTQLVGEKKSISKSHETVDQKGDRPTPESESNEKNQVPFKTWSEEHVPVDQAISAGNIEKQNNSLVSEEESTAGVQETIDIAEKEQPSKSKEQPSRTRRNRKKMIPFHIWLEKHAPADLKMSAESTGMEDVSLDTKQESIPVLQEISEKEQPSKSGAENVIKQDISLPKEEGDQEDSLKKEICEEEPVISTTQLVGEKKSISKCQKEVDQKEEKQTSKTKRIKKTPLLWKSFPESDACIDLAFFTENNDINNGPLPEKENDQAALPSTGNKTFWKMLPKSEPRIDTFKPY
ncbi:muscle M-line assembly protein unc-89-like [Xiphophorus couchianus]|uniref:muscle M-line assembly protein unc-89-like n=1 Tax=Xiphophorus couchianus TaxID=32473 RepID=UPI0010169F99|nr:muscle M-line assembly protein unc-89-like [Xiphophorus couchianus]